MNQIECIALEVLLMSNVSQQSYEPQKISITLYSIPNH